VGKVNVDDEPELATMYGVMSIPTLMLFKNGEVAKTSVGYAPLEKLEDMLK
jgi:thioredoxin 1